MDKEYLRLQEKGLVRFRFMQRPEAIKEGSTILFREGRTQGLGIVSRVIVSDKQDLAYA